MMTIMIVDDHPLVREGMASMLENESDFSVVASVASGRDAVAWCKEKGAPDVVVSDIRMPGMDGFETLAKLRRTHPDIRMLMLAGMPLKAEEEKARAAKARGYLPKSIDWERLDPARGEEGRVHRREFRRGEGGSLKSARDGDRPLHFAGQDARGDRHHPRHQLRDGP